ncbi:RagB/SusD family nutrient uptake outer membrane protein [Carboxylicivirga sp. RSCT41]|uniref:RagB/SusD family nutrient uptake outer membrane protein n=1 Tax=Carboxylicivirga agarovorans TaxID=3417570 RepID=UPI003D328690
MKNYILIVLSALLLFNTGCEVETIPYDSVSSEEVTGPDGLAAVTNGCYAYLKEEYFYKPYHYVPEFGGDNIALSGTTSDRLMNLYNYNRVIDNYHTQRLWEKSYLIIVTLNRLIESNETGVSPELDQILGEDHYLRAFLYLTLTNTFGRPYAQSPETNLAVPLKLTSDPDDTPARATVKEVYDQIVKDLLAAIDLMSEDKASIYATKEAAQALLSRVYLYMGDNENAIKYATDVMDSGRFTLLGNSDISNYFTYSPDENTENIMAVKFVKDEDYLYNGWYTVGSMYANVDGAGWGEMYASKPIRDLLNQNPEDQRIKFIEPQYESEASYTEGGQTIVVKNPMWYIFVEEVEDGSHIKSYFRTGLVVDDAGQWKLAEPDENISGTHVETEEVEGETKYFITWKGEKQYVDIERMMQTRQGYPKYYVLKCSKQQGQAHLWSPSISRLAEMYLNRAEGYAKQGNGDLALSDINVLRQRAGIPTWDIDNLPLGKTVLDLVLEERRMELMFEGHRKFDIFRNGLTLDRHYPGTHDRGADNVVKMTVTPNDNAIVEYIPQLEIDRYPGDLQQNP